MGKLCLHCKDDDDDYYHDSECDHDSCDDDDGRWTNLQGLKGLEKQCAHLQIRKVEMSPPKKYLKNIGKLRKLYN